MRQEKLKYPAKEETVWACLFFLHLSHPHTMTPDQIQTAKNVLKSELLARAQRKGLTQDTTTTRLSLLKQEFERLKQEDIQVQALVQEKNRVKIIECVLQFPETFFYFLDTKFH